MLSVIRWFFCKGETDCHSVVGRLFGHSFEVGYFWKGESEPFRVTNASIQTVRYVIFRDGCGDKVKADVICKRCGKVGHELHREVRL